MALFVFHALRTIPHLIANPQSLVAPASDLPTLPIGDRRLRQRLPQGAT